MIEGSKLFVFVQPNHFNLCNISDILNQFIQLFLIYTSPRFIGFLKGRVEKFLRQRTRPRGHKTFPMLNSAEHESYPAHKC